jgi:hypothetical protein
MTGPSLGPLTRCPFGHCAADVMLVIEQKTPGDDETTQKRVPPHRLVGEAERFGQCPASLMIIPLDAYSREALKTQADSIGRMLAKDAQPREPREAKPAGGLFPVGRPPREGEHPLTPHPDPNHEFQRLGYNGGPKRPTAGPNVPQHGKAGQTVVPLPDEPHAGPGPGRASKPHQPTAADVVEQHVPPKLTVVPPAEPAPPTDQTQQQGSTAGMSDNDLRAQLIALTTLAIEGFAQEQEQCAAMTGALDQTLSGLRVALEAKQKATHTLALAAVGSRSDIPQAAADMIGASASVGTTIEEIEKSIALLAGWIAATHAYAASAAANGRSYLAQI